MKRGILIFILLLSHSVSNAQRAIYLRSISNPRVKSFALENPKDSTLITITDGYHNPEGGGWMVSPGFALRPGIPDDTYYVYVDRDLKQAGWVKAGLYTGKVWQPWGVDGGWKLSVYHKGKKQGPERIIERDTRKQRYYTASVEWYDNDEHPVVTHYHPSGAIAGYAILALYDFRIDEDGTFSNLSERGGTEWTMRAFPMKQGKLDGQALWFKGGNGMGTQWLYVTFKNNEIVRWQLSEALESGATPVVAQYRKSDHESEIE